MNTTATTTTSREQELAAMKAIKEAMFAAQDIWEATGCAVPSLELAAYRTLCVAYGDAVSVWNNPLEELEALYQTQFAAQDAWEATGCAVANEEHKTYKAAFNAYRAARSAWINS